MKLPCAGGKHRAILVIQGTWSRVTVTGRSFPAAGAGPQLRAGSRFIRAAGLNHGPRARGLLPLTRGGNMTEPTPAQRQEHQYNYNYRDAPYDTPEGRANAPQWLKDELPARPAVHADGTPRYTSMPQPPEVFPNAPVPGAVPKNAALYCLLGVIVPGLPSLLL